MSINFPNSEQELLEHDVKFGAQASEIMASKEWAWIQENIFGALQGIAVMTLKTARTEEDRVKAQQQFLAAHKPKELLEQLISTGQAAKVSLDNISTLEGENNG